MDILSELLDDSNVEELGKLNGKSLYSFDDAQKLNKIGLMKEKLQGKTIEFGERPRRDDGFGFKETKADVLAVPSTFFENRYRKVTNSKTKEVTYEVVLDYRACKEQSSGRIYTTNILTYIIGAKKEEGKEPQLVLVGKKSINDTEFTNHFKNKLNRESMAKIINLVQKNKTGNNEDELDF